MSVHSTTGFGSRSATSRVRRGASARPDAHPPPASPHAAAHRRPPHSTARRTQRAATTPTPSSRSSRRRRRCPLSRLLPHPRSAPPAPSDTTSAVPDRARPPGRHPSTPPDSRSRQPASTSPTRSSGRRAAPGTRPPRIAPAAVAPHPPRLSSPRENRRDREQPAATTTHAPATFRHHPFGAKALSQSRPVPTCPFGPLETFPSRRSFGPGPRDSLTPSLRRSRHRDIERCQARPGRRRTARSCLRSADKWSKRSRYTLAKSWKGRLLQPVAEQELLLPRELLHRRHQPQHEAVHRLQRRASPPGALPASHR